MRKLLVVSISLALLGIGTAARAATPPNDNFANAKVISSLPYSDAVDNTDATREAGETNPTCTPVLNTIWYRFTATQNMHLVANVTASDMVTVGGVYLGTTPSNLTPLGCIEEAPAGYESKTGFDVSRGKTYYLQLGSSAAYDPIRTGVIRLSLQPAAFVSGTVKGSNGKPLAACVLSYDENGLGSSVAFSTNNGRYQLGYLPAGQYKILFEDCSAGTRIYASEWYNQKPDQASADVLSVPMGSSTSHINAVLPRGGSITGSVSDSASSAAIQDECVSLYDQSNALVQQVFTAADGSYTIGQLHTGTYHIDFPGCTGRYFSEWYHDKGDFNSSDPISVTLGSTTSGVNEDLVSTSGTGAISGTVTDSLAQPIGGICVSVWSSQSGSPGGAITAGDGTYSITGLATGQYRVQFQGCGQPFSDTWYSSKATFDSADPVAVVDGSTTTGIDQTLQSS